MENVRQFISLAAKTSQKESKEFSGSLSFNKHYKKNNEKAEVCSSAVEIEAEVNERRSPVTLSHLPTQIKTAIHKVNINKVKRGLNRRSRFSDRTADPKAAFRHESRNKVLIIR